MKKTSLSLSVIVLILVILFGVGVSSLVMVADGQVGVRTVKNKTEILQPGLHFVWPGDKPRFIQVNDQVSHFAVSLPNNTETLAVAVMWNVNNVSKFIAAAESPNQVLTDLKQHVQKLVTPQLILKTSSSADLANLLNQALTADPDLSVHGVQVMRVWITGVNPTDAEQKQIFANMKGLAATTGQQIIQTGEIQADAIRNQAEQDFIQSQTAALTDAAKILGEGNSDAVKVMASLYQKSPALFRAYVAAKVKLLTGTQSSS